MSSFPCYSTTWSVYTRSGFCSIRSGARFCEMAVSGRWRQSAQPQGAQGAISRRIRAAVYGPGIRKPARTWGAAGFLKGDAFGTWQARVTVRKRRATKTRPQGPYEYRQVTLPAGICYVMLRDCTRKKDAAGGRRVTDPRAAAGPNLGGIRPRRAVRIEHGRGRPLASTSRKPRNGQVDPDTSTGQPCQQVFHAAVALHGVAMAAQ